MTKDPASDPASVEPAGHDVADGPGVEPGADATARLLLALTTLYVQRSNHTAAEQQQYTELALGLIDKAAPEARAIVAARLQRHPDAPAAVIARLAGTQFPHGNGDGGQPGAAADVLAGDLHAEADPRPDIDSLWALAEAEAADTEAADREPADGDTGPARGPAPSVPARAAPPPLTPELGEAFFAAAPAERRRLLLEVAAAGAPEAAAESGRRFHVRIDTAPWHGRTGAFARDFARLIDAPPGLCDRILNDPWGEPMVVAARATGMPAAILQRILLLASPAAHHPVQRVYELTDLYHALDVRTTRDLLAVWRSAATDGAANTSGNAAENATERMVQLPAPVAITDIRARFRALNARINSTTPRRAD